MSEVLEQLNTENFEERVLKSGVPYLVEYTSPWCSTCAALQPTLEQIGTEMQDTVRIGKVDIFADPSLSESQNVMSTPTMIVFANGKPVKRINGARPKRHIVTELQQVIERN